MSDLIQILPLWKALQTSNTEYVLATVVEVEGSGYRKPGARMLVAADGRRAGTISGGCLEAEVARKAFWHTENGPTMRRYSTSPDDGDVPFGMGCGGVVHVLLERSRTANPLLERLSAAFTARQPLAVSTILEGDAIGQRSFCPEDDTPGGTPKLQDLAQQAFAESRSFSANIEVEDRQIAAVRSEWIPARPGLFIFGAGDDALPLVSLAHQLGWYTAIADGRAHLVTTARFPLADDLHALSAHAALPANFHPTDAAVIMTHSLQQDTHILAHLLQRNLAYLGVLGPRHRTRDMLTAIAQELFVAMEKSQVSQNAQVTQPQVTQAQVTQIEDWFTRLHAPMGLDLGGNAPADIALAIIAEIQQTLHRASGQALRQLRARSEFRAPIAIESRRSAG